MLDENNKAQEIKRLTTPLKYKNSKVYDSEGNLISCVESISDVQYIREPKEGFLSENEILQYASHSKAASRIRLERGFGDMTDVLLVHESLPWLAGLYYVILIAVAIPVVYMANKLIMFILLILAIVPLLYLYRVFNVKTYRISEDKRISGASDVKKTVNSSHAQITGLESLKKYETEVEKLTAEYDEKESAVKGLIEKRFKPPQITYDRFMTTIDSCHELFYTQADAALNISQLAVEDTPKVEKELEDKIDSMKKIIDQIEDLTNELVINISSDKESGDDVKTLLDDMENLIGSVKDY